MSHVMPPNVPAPPFPLNIPPPSSLTSTSAVSSALSSLPQPPPPPPPMLMPPSSIPSSSLSSGSAPANMQAAFPPFQQPPQLSYGWWLDVPPPRGPYLWPCSPENYTPNIISMSSMISSNDHSMNGENDNTNSSRLQNKNKHDSSSHNDDVNKSNPNDISSNSPSDDNDDFPQFSQPPQMAFGWFVPHPPPSGPYLWSCIPPGYTLVPVAASQNPLSLPEKGDSNPNSTVSFGATLTPPTHPTYGPSEHSLNPPHSHNPIHSPSLEALASIAVAPTPYSLGDDDMSRDSDDIHEEKEDKHRDYERNKRLRL